MKVKVFVNGQPVDKLTYEQQEQLIKKAFNVINYEIKSKSKDK